MGTPDKHEARTLTFEAAFVVVLGIVGALWVKDFGLFVMGLVVGAGLLAGAVALRASPDDRHWWARLARWFAGGDGPKR